MLIYVLYIHIYPYSYNTSRYRNIHYHMFCNENGFDFYAVLWCNARLASILPVKQRLFYIPIMITTFFFGKLKQLLWKQTTKIRRTIKMHRSLMRNIFCWEVNWFYILHLPCVRLDTFSKIQRKWKISYLYYLLLAPVINIVNFNLDWNIK